MQPYFIPYIGYFQLLGHCDAFVVYDDIEYTKKGWINRNRLLSSGEPRVVTLPLRRASDFAQVRDREIAPEFEPAKMLNLFRHCYGKAPHWEATEPLLHAICEHPDRNLFGFVHHSITTIVRSLQITTEIVVSSTLALAADLRGEDRVLAICAAVGATEYINPIGGLDLYHDQAFADRGIQLRFLRSKLTPYPQFDHPFVEALSIVDVMMFCAPFELVERVRSDYDIITR